MKKNNKIIIGVLVVLILIIAVSGCFSSFKGERTNSTYNGSVVSFIYPSDYVITEVNRENGIFLKGNKTDDRTFEVSKKSINQSFDSQVSGIKQLLIEDPSLQTKIVNEKNLTVDGSKAYQTTYTMVIAENIVWNTYTVFDKNGSRYVILFTGDYTNYDTDIVVNSLKVT